MFIKGASADYKEAEFPKLCNYFISTGCGNMTSNHDEFGTECCKFIVTMEIWHVCGARQHCP